MNRSWRIYLPVILLCVVLVGCGGKDVAGSRKEYVPGERSETEYRSEWAGLRYQLNDDMVMATDEEINSMMELSAEALDVDSARIDYAKLVIVYEMMAVNVTDQSNIVIFTEKLALSNMNEEQYLNSVKGQIEEMYAGYSITYGDGGAWDICGLTFTGMEYVVDYGAATLHQTYLVRKIDGRMYGLVLNYGEKNALDALLSGFSAYLSE